MIRFQGLEEIIPGELLALASPEVIQQAMLALGEGARDYWVRQAAELVTSRRDYVNGILPVEYGEDSFTITLVGVVANIVEGGMEETDLHDTLLGPNVQTAPPGQRGKHPRKGGGFYRAVPFRQATPTSSGQAGQPMGRPYGDTEKLGQSIYSAAKKLKPGQRLPEGLAPKLKPHHKTDIYAGMQRQTKQYDKAQQSSYVTFRTISTDSPGWVRPATDGRNYVDRVADWVEDNAEANLQIFLDEL